ncbi:hypothetical protein [Mycobacterium sp. UM_CSW]|uniref:hypothetical protein n=1 Tax=Mycobacterium sp. UM_CSW TaxID=1370119 RepID=UPI000419D2B7|nr:hypothetical protein [Mycobacterium sp. UM_CSW]
MKILEGEDVPADLREPTHRYLAGYKLDDDPATVMKAFLAKVAAGEIPLSEAADLTTISPSP